MEIQISSMHGNISQEKRKKERKKPVMKLESMIAHWLRVLDAPAEDPGLVPSPQPERLTDTSNSSSTGPTPSSGLCGHCKHMVHIMTHT